MTLYRQPRRQWYTISILTDIGQKDQNRTIQPTQRNSIMFSFMPWLLSLVLLLQNSDLSQTPSAQIHEKRLNLNSLPPPTHSLLLSQLSLYSLCSSLLLWHRVHSFQSQYVFLVSSCFSFAFLHSLVSIQSHPQLQFYPEAFLKFQLVIIPIIITMGKVAHDLKDKIHMS